MGFLQSFDRCWLQYKHFLLRTSFVAVRKLRRVLDERVEIFQDKLQLLGVYFVQTVRVRTYYINSG